MVTVVGVAILAADAADAAGRRRVLAARRAGPQELAGRWELPGGKVLPGESLEEAAEREVAEELGCRVRVTGRLDGVQPVRPGLELRVMTAELVEGVPTATVHDGLRWLAFDELHEVDWLAPDVPFLEQLRAGGKELP